MNLKSKNIFENEDYIYEYFSLYDEIYRDILMQMVERNKTKIILTRIKPSMYQQALMEFMKYGHIIRYPVKYIIDWKDIVIRNFAYLDVITMFFGHQSNFDIDTFNDIVLNTDETGESVSSWNDAMEYIEEHGYEDILEAFLPKFSNGSDLISDFGLEPLRNIVEQLLQTDDPNKILVLINKALDISHPRSDLSELFIEGGQNSLDKIFGSGLDQNMEKIINEEIIKFLNNI